MTPDLKAVRDQLLSLMAQLLAQAGHDPVKGEIATSLSILAAAIQEGEASTRHFAEMASEWGNKYLPGPNTREPLS